MSLLRLSRCFSTGFRRCNPIKSETFWQKYRRQLKENPLPIWAGLLVVGYLQFRRIRRQQQQQNEGELKETSPSRIVVYEWLPWGTISRTFGFLSEVKLPLWVRRNFFSWYVNKFGCNMSEACHEDVTSYNNVAQFFARNLKEGARPIDTKAPVVVPCDGKVLSCGPIDPYGYVEQVKGISYPLKDFIGPYLSQRFENSKIPTKLFHITIYLAPGDYHHFHSPTDWTISNRRHYPGKLLSVGLWAAKTIPRLFVHNERAVYLGQWSEGLFTMTAVGATNVGSITVERDPDLKTNRPKKFRTSDCNEFVFPNEVSLNKGEHFGQFNLGSTVVLVFEAPKDFKFCVEPGQKVLLGQSLGNFSK